MLGTYPPLPIKPASEFSLRCVGPCSRPGIIHSQNWQRHHCHHPRCHFASNAESRSWDCSESFQPRCVALSAVHFPTHFSTWRDLRSHASVRKQVQLHTSGWWPKTENLNHTILIMTKTKALLWKYSVYIRLWLPNLNKKRTVACLLCNGKAVDLPCYYASKCYY